MTSLQALIKEKKDQAIALYLDPESPEALLRYAAPDVAYIYTPDTHDIRSEGQSYGMYIAVHLGDQILFDALWRFAQTFQQNAEGECKDLFAWQLKGEAPFAVMDANPAPDGELYYAFALLKAHEKWGSKENSKTFNYLDDAQRILNRMLDPYESETFRPFFNREFMQVVFTTDKDCAAFTDPSYHLPHFLEKFAQWDQIESQKKLWRQLAQSSRNFLEKAAHPQTGLFSDYATFEGKPQPTSFNPNSHFAGMDAIRVVMNLIMDGIEFGYSTNAQSILQNQSAFYLKNDSVSIQTLEGQAQCDFFNEGHIATLAHLYLWDLDKGRLHLERFLTTPLPLGRWRYYSGILTLISLIHLEQHIE